MFPRILCFLLLVATCFPAHAQVQLKTVVSSVFYFRQRIDVHAYAGKPYRLAARTKVTAPAGDSADANVIAAVFDKNKKFLSVTAPGAMRNKHRDGQWHTFSASGRLPAAAGFMMITNYVYLNGTFGYDDFKLETETSKGSWQAVPVVNGDFSATRSDSTSGFPNGWRPIYQVAGFSSRAATEASGNGYLEITGQDVVDYGRNAKAGHTVAVNGIKLYYETYGSGEPLLLLHGNGQSISAFTGQIPELAKHYQVIAVDTRAQGKSTTDGKELTYDLFAEDMNALLETLRVPAAHVVGWSDGGNNGLSLALHHPDKVKRLVTMGANLYADTTAVKPATLKEVRQGKLMTTLLWPVNKRMRQMRPLTVLLLKYPRMKPAELKAIQAPTLVLAGEKDVIQDAHTRLIAASLPRGQVQVFPKLTHYAPQEDPAVFNAAVLRFLQTPAGN